MTIDIRFRSHLSSPSLRDHILQRAKSRLDRFFPDLRSVVVHLSYCNGLRGGVDKVCKITLTGPHIETHTVEKTTSDAYTAADLALETAQHNILKLLERRRSTQRRQS